MADPLVNIYIKTEIKHMVCAKKGYVLNNELLFITH